MSLPTEKQFLELIERSHRPLIVTRKDWTPDGLGSALALAAFLDKRGKRPVIVCGGFSPAASIAFLPGLDRVKPTLGAVRPFVIALDITKAKIDELSYDVTADSLRITVVPKPGATFSPIDVTTPGGEFAHDLIIAVDAPDLGSLGRIFEEHAEFFTHVPKIVVGHDPACERYGALNLVDVAATSCGEILHGLIKSADAAALTPDVATCLLAGIIAKTHSFRSPAVTPRTLEAASDLVAAGARREEIVQRLYRTRSIATLKLWGRALARLKHDAALGLAWTVLVRPDFVHAGASEDQLPDVIDELIANSPEAEIIAVIYEQESPAEPGQVDGICALVSTDRHGDALRLVAPLRPEGTRTLARLCFPRTPIIEAEKQITQTIARSLGRETKPANVAAQEKTPA
jgi:nanoRNase/pAp phosphatase (c-di-AMP/oligoRNAs hydrolase)